MDQARIAELLVPFLGPPGNRKSGVQEPGPDIMGLVPDISMYIDILIRWNSKVNLTAIRSPEEIVTRHFGESLFAARHLFPKEPHVGTAALGCPAEQSSAAAATTAGIVTAGGRVALHGRGNDPSDDPASAPITDPGQRPAGNDHTRSLADIGSGAGFPGIPIKLWAPQIALTLIESNHKKVAFLREVARALILTNIDIQNARVEAMAPAAFDVVTLRAVERFESILPAAARLVAPEGRLALLVSSPQIDTARRLTQKFAWQEPIAIPNSNARVLAIATADFHP